MTDEENMKLSQGDVHTIHSQSEGVSRYSFKLLLSTKLYEFCVLIILYKIALFHQKLEVCFLACI